MLLVLTRAVLFAVLVLASGCGARLVPRLVAGPFTADASLFDRAMTATVQRGYHPEGADRERGTFYVTARSELRVPITFEVRCTRDGWVLVVPHGERVEERVDGYSIRGRAREEYLGFVAALQRGITLYGEEEVAPGPPVPWETSF